MADAPKTATGGPLAFVKKIPLRTWIIGAFVALFLIWFIPKLGMFTKIAGALGIAAALGFLAPILLPLIAGLLGGLAAAIAGAIAAFKRKLKETGDTDQAKDAADTTKENIEDNAKEQNFEGEAAKAAENAGFEKGKELMEDDDGKAEDVDNEIIDSFNDAGEAAGGVVE